MRIFEGFQRGINLGGWLSQCVSRTKEHFDTFITEADVQKIAGWGLDHVRLPVDYDIIRTDEGAWKEDGLAYVDACIRWCRDAGIHMILDVHKTKGYMFDANEVEDADRFFTDEALQDYFVELWRGLAGRYAKDAKLVAFELLNEITNPAYGEAWNGIAARAIGEIRKLAPENYIIVGGTNYNSVLKVPELLLPPDDRIVYNFHCYEPLVFTHQKAYWVDGMTDDFSMSYPAPLAEIRTKSEPFAPGMVGAVFADCLDEGAGSLFEQFFAAAVRTAEERNVPLYCGEYGVIDRAPLEDTLAWIREIHCAFEAHRIGRALWNYKDRDFGLVDAHYDALRAQIIQNL